MNHLSTISTIPALQALLPDSAQTAARGPAPTGFGQALNQALHELSHAQQHSAYLQHEVQMDNPAVSLEQAMLALQKTQIGFQAALHVRGRLVQAYTDIMNMQV